MEIDQSLDLKQESVLDRAVLYAATGLFAFTIVLTTVQVFVRWLDLPTFGFLHWTEPLARFVLIIATYLGAAVAVRNDEHIAIEFLLERLTERAPTLGDALSVVVDGVVVAFLAIALRGTVQLAIGDWGTSIGGIGAVTSGHLYLGISVGLTLMIAYALWDAIQSLRSLIATVGDAGTADPDAADREVSGDE